MPYGLQAMLKEGHKHFSGLDEAVYKNIEAGKQLSQIARTSMGPNGKMLLVKIYCTLQHAGDSTHQIICLSLYLLSSFNYFWRAGMNKMVINHLEKLFVTRDASTIINELEVEHPAARLLVFAAQAQQQEIGDGTNFVRLNPADLKLNHIYPSLHSAVLLQECLFRSAVVLVNAQVVSFAGDLLNAAEGLLREGLHTSEVAEGYTKAAAKVC